MKTLIIAEAGVNHNGELKNAFQLVDCAVQAGADIVKFQTFKSNKVVTRFADKAEYQKKNTGVQENQLDMIKKLELSDDDHYKILEYCKKQKIEFLSTAFDFESLDFIVDKLGVKRMKVPSGEITNAPYLLAMAQKRLPMIVSTGMCTIGEVETALGVIAFGFLFDRQPKNVLEFAAAYASAEGQAMLRDNVTLLHCTTEYPASFSSINLNAMNSLGDTFQLPFGYSDHTMGIHVPIAAVAKGARIIEKHFTLDKKMPGPDHKASLNPQELADMVRCIRDIEGALGSPLKIPSASEIETAKVARRSLVAASPIRKGELFCVENIEIKRPGTGMSPMLYWSCLGKPAPRDFQPDEVLQ